MSYLVNTGLTDSADVTIADFYKGRDILITGATGFIGKALIEKLLRSCSSLNRIFILTRPKRGKSFEERVKVITDNPLFDTLRVTAPKSLEKISVVSGDASQLKLGLSEEDMKRLSNVSIIFHAAASVRFDDPLKTAILLNTRGTRELMEVALNFKQLKALVHVSTTYSNPDILNIEEKIYPPHGNWRKMIQIAETFDVETLDSLGAKITDYMPNTYTYTKGLAEQICNDYKDKLPILVLRPSIVTNVYKEPLQGWIDNFNGPCGLLASSGCGIFRTLLTDSKSYINYVPVDTCVRAMIVSSWTMGTSQIKEPLPIYNCSSLTVKLSEMINEGRRTAVDSPPSLMVWLPGGHVTNWKVYYIFRKACYEIFPAMFIDLLFRLARRKPILLKVQRLSFNAVNAIKYFIDRPWVFQSDNYESLEGKLLAKDKADFQINVRDLKFTEYMDKSTLGARRFLFHNKDEDIPKDQQLYRKLKFIDTVIRYIKNILMLYLIINYAPLCFGLTL